MKYKISDVKQILNISEDTLRYFDNKKIIKTTRDKNNNYRYFKAEDINKIFAYKMYRSLKFNMNESDLLISGKPIAVIESKLQEQLEHISKEQEYLDRVNIHITLLTEKIRKWRQFKDGFEIMDSPNCYYHGNQTDTCFVRDEDIFKNTYQCLNCLPDIWPCFCYAPDHFKPFPGFSFGYGFYSDQAPFMQGLLKLPSTKCLYTMFVLKGNLVQFLPKLIKKAEHYCHDCGYTLEGVIHGSIIHEIKEEDHFIRLFDIYMPIV